jgi:hypothetical protein
MSDEKEVVPEDEQGQNRKERTAIFGSYLISALIHSPLVLLLVWVGVAQMPAPAPAGGAKTYVTVDIVSDTVREGVSGETHAINPENNAPPEVKDTQGNVRMGQEKPEPVQPQEQPSQVANKTGEKPQPATGPKPPGAKPGDKANNGMGTEGPGKLYGPAGNGSVPFGTGKTISPFPGTAAGGLEPSCTKTDRNVGTKLTYSIELDAGNLSIEHIGSDPPADPLTAQNTLGAIRRTLAGLKLDTKATKYKGTVTCDCGDNDCRIE